MIKFERPLFYEHPQSREWVAQEMIRPTSEWSMSRGHRLSMVLYPVGQASNEGTPALETLLLDDPLMLFRCEAQRSRLYEEIKSEPLKLRVRCLRLMISIGFVTLEDRGLHLSAEVQ